MTLAVPLHAMAWRLVFAQVATLQEVDTHYRLSDILDAVEILEAREAAERKAHEAASKRR